MKRIIPVLLFLTICAPLAFAQGGAADLPRIAVYVTGSVPDNERKALGTRMLATLINSGRYKGIERSNAFLAELDKEQTKQRSGAIDDNQITELGKQFGVRYVCIADITPAFGTFQVSARIIDVETAEVVFIGESYSNLRSADDLKNVSNEVVVTMFGGVQPAMPPQPEAEQSAAALEPPPAQEAQPAQITQPPPQTMADSRAKLESAQAQPAEAAAATPPKERGKNAVRFGARLGLNLGKYFDGYDGEYNVGPGVGGSIIVAIPLAERLSLSPEVGVFYRELFNFTPGDGVQMSLVDIVLSVPIMARYEPFEGVPLYVALGFQIDASVMNEYKRSGVSGEGDVQEALEYRAAADVGFVFGGGYMITERIGADLRLVVSMTPLFTPEEGVRKEGADPFGSLVQFGVGFTVLY